MTLYQHEIRRRYARRSVSEHLDAPALCRAGKRIEEIVARERVRQRRLSGRQKAARFLNLGQPDYEQRAALPSAIFHAPEINVNVLIQTSAPISMDQVETPIPEEGSINSETGWNAAYSLPNGKEAADERRDGR